MPTFSVVLYVARTYEVKADDPDTAIDIARDKMESGIGADVEEEYTDPDCAEMGDE